MGIPQNGWFTTFTMENPIKMHGLGARPFQEASYFDCTEACGGVSGNILMNIGSYLGDPFFEPWTCVLCDLGIYIDTLWAGEQDTRWPGKGSPPWDRRIAVPNVTDRQMEFKEKRSEYLIHIFGGNPD